MELTYCCNASRTLQSQVFRNFLCTLNTCRPLESTRCFVNVLLMSFTIWRRTLRPRSSCVGRLCSSFFMFLYFCVFGVGNLFRPLPWCAAKSEMRRRHTTRLLEFATDVGSCCHVLAASRIMTYSPLSVMSSCRPRVLSIKPMSSACLCTDGSTGQHVKAKLSKTIRSDCHNSGAFSCAVQSWLDFITRSCPISISGSNSTKNSSPSSTSARKHTHEMSNVTADHDCLVLHTRT